MSERVIISLMVGLFLCGSVRADLVLYSTYDFPDLPQISVSRDLESRIAAPPSPAHPLSMRGFEPLRLFPEPRYDLDEPAAPAHFDQIASDSGQSSLSLCLSALVSLGLYTSMHSVKKLSFGFDPQWYHTGGPFRIGHSMAICLDSVCPVPVCCLAQPDHGVANTVPKTRFGTVVSQWRTSQFTPELLAARGPPVAC